MNHCTEPRSLVRALISVVEAKPEARLSESSALAAGCRCHRRHELGIVAAASKRF